MSQMNFANDFYDFSLLFSTAASIYIPIVVTFLWGNQQGLTGHLQMQEITFA